MISLNERIIKLREKAFAWKDNQNEYIGQRLYYALEGLVSSNSDDPWMKRKSIMLSNIINKSNVIIHEDELIVGYNYYGDDVGMCKEINIYPRGEEQKKELLNYLEKGELSEEQIDFIMSTISNIEHYNHHSKYFASPSDEYLKARDEGVIWSEGICENHTVIGYERVLKLGFLGILKEIQREIENLDWTNPSSIKKKLLLECAYDIASNACNIGKRYKKVVQEQIIKCNDEKRKSELENLAKVLDKVPNKPAETFYEAVQSLWFAHIINTWEDGINANSLGRIDQILYPYYKKDIELGRITHDEAYELLCCLWIKLYRDYDVQQAMIGGLTNFGEDATNELSYMMLDVTEMLGFVRCLSVRVHNGSSLKLIKRSLEIVGCGNGVPFFFNDDVIIPALVQNGIELEDARDYAAIGCIEITIPGKANPHAVSNRVNLLKCLELALNDGVSITTGNQIGLKTGNCYDLKSIEDIIGAYKKQAEYFTGIACFESNRLEMQNSLTLPMIYKSILTEGCIEKGLDFNDGGAKYNYHESMAMGIPNVADSLVALQKFVFDDEKYTLSEVVTNLKNNFPNELIRQEFLNRSPKYGNDDDTVDMFAVDIMAHFCNTVKNIKGVNGLGFFAQPFTYLWLVEAGEKTGATPDGRKNGENLAYSVSPMQGRDNKGLTAVFNSIAKLPSYLAAGSISAIIEIDPMLFNDNKLDQLVILLKTAFEKGVGQVQFNVTNAETLIKAQAEPEKYNNLAVRVSGFSQRFCLLDKKLQDHIIARTKHKTL